MIFKPIVGESSVKRKQKI